MSVFHVTRSITTQAPRDQPFHTPLSYGFSYYNFHGLCSTKSNMFVHEIMTDRVKTISQNSSLKDAARQMDEINIGVLPVVEGDRMIGIITDRDIVIRSVSAGQDPNITLVKDAMTSPVIFCFDDQTIEESTQIMEKFLVHRLPVLDRTLRLVGILTTDDLLVDAPDRKMVANLLEALSIPFKSAS